jgi:dihydrodipicolinate synthase/N-acetylneuraminate lyase
VRPLSEPRRLKVDLCWGIADRGDLRPAVSTYSSAVFNFVPEFATAFYAAVRRCDHAVIDAGLRNFILPLIAIRNRKKGYAVSIIKAA